MYLEDIGVDDIREVQCVNCGHEEEAEGTHYRDSETFRWQCRCGYLNEIAAPVAEYPDPDDWHDERMIEKHFGHN